MLLECPICELHTNLEIEVFLNEKETICSECDGEIHFFNTDGTPVFLKLSIGYKDRE